jgi:hypothetical protein
MPVIHWKVGYEIELLAPSRVSRKDLALRLAEAVPGGTIAPVFVPQAELINLEGVQVFENLTLGYDALDSGGRLIARCADDLTLQADLDRSAPPKPGWYRIVGDDARILRLVMRHSDPTAPIDQVLIPSATLFGADLQHFDNGMIRLADSLDAPIAMATHLPGERERPCEIITPPIVADHRERLEALLAPAVDMGFTVPTEAALHIHFDAAALCTASAFAKLVVIFSRFGDQLKRMLKTNPACTRLGTWPQELIELVSTSAFENLDWGEARARLSELQLTKYVDFNVINMVRPQSEKHTFEVRILPVVLDSDAILDTTALLEGLLRVAINPSIDVDLIKSRAIGYFIESMPIEAAAKANWLKEAKACA